MMTRQEMMNAKDKTAAHHQYYGEIAQAMGLNFNLPAKLIERSRKALKNGDEHLNSIPLKEWDTIAHATRYHAAPHLKERGDGGWSLGAGVCIVKAAARIAAEGSQP